MLEDEWFVFSYEELWGEAVLVEGVEPVKANMRIVSLFQAAFGSYFQPFTRVLQEIERDVMRKV